jgi:coenzyme F420-reducing hydrogenase delta subunit
MGRNNPKIVAFCCEESGMPAYEHALSLGLELPKGLSVVALPCGGKAETGYILRALDEGADAVMIFACYEGNCKYVRGNIRAEKRVNYLKKRLEKLGLSPEKVAFCPVAPASGARFAELVRKEAEVLREDL